MAIEIEEADEPGTWVATLADGWKVAIEAYEDAEGGKVVAGEDKITNNELKRIEAELGFPIDL